MKLSTGQCDCEEVKDLIPDKQLTRLIEKHNSLQHQINELTAQLNSIKGKIKDDMIKSDLKSREVSNPDTRHRVTLVKPESLVYDDVALIDLLKGKKLWSRCQSVSVDRQAVEEVVREGKVTIDEMDKVSHLEKGTPYIRIMSPVKGGK